MHTPAPAKLDKFREQLRQEWTDEETVAAWRKWHAEIADFSRGATQAILEAAQLRPGMRVLDLASGVGDPALSIAEAVGPSGHVTATDLGPGMIGLAEELARSKGLKNIEFRVANAESLPFPDESFDRVTCRFGIMFFPDQVRALRECRRVLKAGGRVAFLAWGKRDQPFFHTTAGVLLKYAQVPPPDPDAPHPFMFGESGRLRRALEAGGFSDAHEEVHTIPARWGGSLEQYRQQFSEIAAPFRPLIATLAPEARAKMEAEILAALRQFWDGQQLTLPLELVIGTGVRG